MTTLLDALQTNNTTTLNGMPTNSSSLNSCVNLFFKVGAMRGQETQELINIFVKAFNEDALTTIKLLFWARDVRGGAGERQIFRDLIKYFANKHTNVIEKNINLISEYGRWDDLLVLIGTPLETQALTLYAEALKGKVKAEKILANLNNLSEDECLDILTNFDKI